MRIILSIWAVLGFLTALSGQETGYYEDLEFWSSVGLSYDVNKKATAGLKLARRFDYNASRLRSQFAHFRLSYNLKKNIRLETAYRITKGKRQMNHRWLISGRYKYRVKPFDLVYRLRLEHDKEPNEFDLFNTVRNRVTFRYKRKKHAYRPYLSMESFTTIDGSSMVLERMRYKVGLDYKLGKYGGIELSYGYQREYYAYRPTAQYIIASSYTYDW